MSFRDFIRKLRGCKDKSIASSKEEIHQIHFEIHKLRRTLMATKQEVLDAIAAEKQQVADGLEALNQKIVDLQTQIANGTAVTAADLDEISAAVNDIFVPPVV